MVPPLNAIAAGLAALTAAIHLIAGGEGALQPMLDAGLPAPAAGAMHAVWHIVSLLLAMSAWVFWRNGKETWYFAMLWAGSGVIFIYVGLFQGGVKGLITNPQWTILLVTAAIALLADRQRTRAG